MEISSGKRDFDKLIKFLSFSYLLLTIAGLLYYFAYYRSFGITITEYIDLGEVLLLFTPFLDSFRIVLMIWIMSAAFFNRLFLRKVIYKRFTDAAARKKYAKSNVITLCILIVLMIGFFLIGINQDIPFMLLGVVFSFLVFVLEDFYDLILKKYIDVSNFVREIVIIILAFIQITIVGYNSDVKLKTQKDQKVTYQLLFKSTEPTVLTDNNLVYLGRTRNFIFLHDLTHKSNRIINVDDVKEVLITKK